ncbi:MAG: O-antigen ligase domain-containing protein [Sphingobacteriia bacterium]|nr:MAG: O-antigen ligase domain-containing protein [Sphingobacteriia bacterium]
MHKFTPAHSRNRKLVNIGLLIAGFGLFFAYSRGAWLALIVGLLAAWLIRKKIIFKTIIAAMVLIVICITTLSYQNNYLRFAPEHDQTIFHTDFRDHINATVTLKDISNAERFHRWVAGIRMVAEKPFTGFGPNSFYSQYQPYTVSSFKTWVSNNPEHSTVHNYFLLTAIEQGILGLILLLAFWMYLLIQSQTLYHQFKNKFHQAIALANGTLLSMIACINFTSDLIETDKIGGLFWLSVGIIIILEIKLKQEQQHFY